MTGSRSVPARAGVHTDRVRQSSLSAALLNTMSGKGLVWMHRSPKAVARRTPVHETAGCGGAHRSAPTGGAAYGMPRNVRIPGSVPVAPSTTPVLIRTSSAARTGSPHRTPTRTMVAKTERVINWRTVNSPDHSHSILSKGSQHRTPPLARKPAWHEGGHGRWTSSATGRGR